MALGGTLLLTAACGGDAEGAGSDSEGGGGGAESSIEVNAEAQALLPEDIRSAGSIVIAINPEAPPIKYLNEEQQVDGLIVDLVNEATARLGLAPEYAQTTFDGLIPGVGSGRYNMIASIGDYAERHEQLDLIDYMVKGVSIIVPAGNPDGISSPEDLCGLSVTFVRGVYAGELAEQTSQACEAGGEQPLELMPLEDSAATELALQSGQVDAEWGDSPEAAYRSEVKPDLYEVAHFEEVGPYGIGFPKDEPELTEAYRTVLLDMAADGTFEEIMDEWGLADSRLDEFPMNQGPEQS
jgi:polar amino acid transport system substrate-binding protein